MRLRPITVLKFWGSFHLGGKRSFMFYGMFFFFAFLGTWLTVWVDEQASTKDIRFFYVFHVHFDTALDI